MSYKLVNITDSITGVTKEDDFIIRKSDNASVPKDENNIDYQNYLAWVADGNTPEAAD